MPANGCQRFPSSWNAHSSCRLRDVSGSVILFLAGATRREPVHRLRPRGLLAVSNDDVLWCEETVESRDTSEDLTSSVRDGLESVAQIEQQPTITTAGGKTRRRRPTRTAPLRAGCRS